MRMSQSIKPPASIPPTANDIAKDSQRDTLSLPARAGVLLVGSAMIVFVTRRFIYDHLKPYLQPHVHVPMSDSEGFALQAGAITALATAVVQKKRDMTRREILELLMLSAGAGVVAATGAAVRSVAVDSVKNEQPSLMDVKPKE